MINFKELMDRFMLDRGEVGTVLFPDNKFPAVAADRIISGSRDITLNQVEALAQYLGTDRESLLSGKISEVCAVITFPDNPVKVRVLDNGNRVLFYLDNSLATTLALGDIASGEQLLNIIILEARRIAESEATELETELL